LVGPPIMGQYTTIRCGKRNNKVKNDINMGRKPWAYDASYTKELNTKGQQRDLFGSLDPAS